MQSTTLSENTQEMNLGPGEVFINLLNTQCTSNNEPCLDNNKKGGNDHYHLALIAFLVAVTFLTFLYQTYIRKYIDKFYKSLNKIKIIERIKQKQTALQVQQEESKYRFEIALAKSQKTKKRWYEKNDDIQLEDEFNFDEDQFDNHGETEKSTVNDSLNLPKEKEIKRKSKNISAVTKQVMSSSMPTQPVTSQQCSDKILTWDKHLPRYNLTADLPDDKSYPIYRTTSKKRFLYINTFLLDFLKDNTAVKNVLTKLCDRPKDQLANHSKGQDGWIVREEQNATKLDKNIIKSDDKEQHLIHSKKAKNTAKTPENKQTYYIKGKKSKTPGLSGPRFYGKSIAITNDGMTFFEIRGCKEHHKDKEITYFQSNFNTSKVLKK